MNTPSLYLQELYRFVSASVKQMLHENPEMIENPNQRRLWVSTVNAHHHITSISLDELMIAATKAEKTLKTEELVHASDLMQLLIDINMNDCAAVFIVDVVLGHEIEEHDTSNPEEVLRKMQEYSEKFARGEVEPQKSLAIYIQDSSGQFVGFCPIEYEENVFGKQQIKEVHLTDLTDLESFEKSFGKL